MKLRDIIKDCGVMEAKGNLEAEITSVCNDSRQAAPGAMFIAVKGFASDGHDYIGKAIEAGAAAIVYEDETLAAAQVGAAANGPAAEAESAGAADTDKDAAHDIALVRVASSRLAVALMAANFYGRPSSKLKLIGITGTNGKTTTVTLLYNLFMSQGRKCGLLSTIANYVGAKKLATANTTSDPITINSLLSEMAAEGCEYCFMEVSSIGIEQDRVAGLDFAAGIFSNLTHDHLDYHKTFAEYLRCKKLFFDNLPKTAVAITNIDDKNGEVMLQNCKARKVTYSCRKIADHSCKALEESFEGMMLRIDGKEIWTRLTGRHNAYNLLAAYSAAVETGADPEATLVALSQLGPAPGRLEVMNGPDGLAVVIDYAHTPDALENVLETLGEIGGKKRQIICLFGCGGDRDRTKRPEMAQVAEKLADRIIVTSDNSRTEKTENIMEDIRAGLSFHGQAKSLFIADRKEAIRTALMTAQDGAVILLAGKGHETYQIIGNERRHFDEREIVSEVFAAMENQNKLKNSRA